MHANPPTLIVASRAAFLCALLGLVGGQNLSAQSDQVSFIDAAELYRDACSACHGALGDGQGDGARLLGATQPRDFTAGVFKFRTTPTGSLPTDEDLFLTISRGVPGTWMPQWEGMLSEDQRWALIEYIKGFSEFFAFEEPDPPVSLPAELPVSVQLVSEGHFVYVALKCAQCHGPLGRGDGPSADELTDDWDREIRPYDFTRGGYRSGSAPSDIYRTLATGLSGTPMPAFEQGIVLFPGGPEVNIGSMTEGLDAETANSVRTYLDRQPTMAQIDSLSPAEARDLAEHRRWALVHYVRSLGRPPSLFFRLFGENPELSTGRGGS